MLLLKWLATLSRDQQLPENCTKKTSNKPDSVFLLDICTISLRKTK